MNYIEKLSEKVEAAVKVPAEIYSRVSGYYRPVAQWNKGKQEEKAERRDLKI